MKKWIVLLLLIAVGWYWQYEPPAHWRGLPAAHDPVQSDRSVPAVFTHGEYTITPLATYQLSAVVLSRSHYRFDRGAALAPIDLALGWGPMSAAACINDLHFSQSGRWYEYRWNHEPPLAPEDIIRHSANTHCLPADAEIRRQLLAVKQHDLVSLKGYLVQISAPDGFNWRSSLSREDTGGHSCEVFWITSVVARALD